MIDLENMLSAEAENTFIHKSIRIGKTKQLQVYLVAERLSEAEMNKRRRSIGYRAKRKAQTPSTLMALHPDFCHFPSRESPHAIIDPDATCHHDRVRWHIQISLCC